MAQTAQIWLLVNASLIGIIIVPAIVVWFLTLGLARKRGDPARVSFTWLKACHPFFALSLILIVISDVAAVILTSWQYSTGSYDTVNHSDDAIRGLSQTYTYSGQIGVFFERIVNALFVIVFAELGNGFRYAQAKMPPPFRDAVRITAFAVAVIIFALSVAYFALPLAANVQYYQSRSSDDYAALVDAGAKARRLRAAGDAINFVVSVAQVVYAVLVARQHAGLPGRKSTTLYLVATVLDLVRWVVLIVLLGAWIMPASEDIPDAWNVVDPLFDTWIRFIILVLLLVIGNRRQDGVWSTIQHWMQGHQAAYPQQAAPPYGPVSNQPAHYQYQQQNPGWQYPPSGVSPAGAYNPHELPSQQVVRPEELDSSQMQPVYAYQGAVEVSAEKKA